MPALIELSTRRLQIRQLQSRDASLVLEHILTNREFIKKWAPRRSESYYTKESQEKVLNPEKISSVRLYLFEKGKLDQIMGEVSFANIILGPFRSCTLGYSVLGDREGEGFIFEALEASIQYMFDVRALHRIEANVMPSNERSIRLLERLNFKREGLHGKYLKIDGRWQDHLSFALLNTDPSI